MDDRYRLTIRLHETKRGGGELQRLTVPSAMIAVKSGFALSMFTSASESGAPLSCMEAACMPGLRALRKSCEVKKKSCRIRHLCVALLEEASEADAVGNAYAHHRVQIRTVITVPSALEMHTGAPACKVAHSVMLMPATLTIAAPVSWTILSQLAPGAVIMTLLQKEIVSPAPQAEIPDIDANAHGELDFDGFTCKKLQATRGDCILDPCADQVLVTCNSDKFQILFNTSRHDVFDLKN